MNARNTPTGHFSSEAWFDFGRGVVPSEQRALMQHHLDDGCSSCSRLYETWAAVLSIAGMESAYQPPEGAVRLAKAAYAADQLWRPLSRRVRLAQLVFDSFRQPATVGSRGSVLQMRETIHKSGPFRIHMRMEPDSRRNRVFVVGQIVNSKTHSEDMKDVQVVVRREEEILARTTTNPFGEFHLEFADGENLRLFLGVSGNRTIAIDLAEPQALRADSSDESELS